MPQAGQFNPAERHLEKGVLALCAIIFIYGLFHWIFSSPRSFEVPAGRVGTEEVSPDQVDENLLNAAEQIQKYMKNARVEDVQIPDYLERLTNHQNAKMLGNLPSFMNVASARQPLILPDIIAEDRYIDFEKLAKGVPAPQPPSVWVGQELPAQGTPADVVAAHVASIYPWNVLVENWNEETRKRPRFVLNVAALDVEAQVQQKQADGTWGAAQNVRAVVASPTETAADGQTTPPEIPTYTGQNAEAIQKIINTIKSTNWQEYILQPPYWQVWSTAAAQWASWLMHLPEDVISQVTKTVTGRVPVKDYQPRDKAEPETERRTPPPKRMPPLPAERTDTSGINRDKMPRRRPEKARETPLKPEQPTVPRSIEGPAMVQLPSLAEQMKTGDVLIWQHTIGLKKGVDYRYRVRLELLNPVFTYEDAVAPEKNKDAYKKSITSKWSPWSAPVRHEHPAEIFLTGSSPSQGTVNVTVFTLSLGQRHERNFTVAPGEAIGKKVSMRITNPRDGTEEIREVDFSTGATLVDVDYEHRMIDTAATRRRARQTVKMLYVDANGKLHSAVRISELRTDSPARKRYENLREESRRKIPRRSGAG